MTLVKDAAEKTVSEPMPARLDHIVIAARSLEQGAEYVRARLGVSAPMGGCHDKMGTHNLLMQLGSAYLEVIAIDPAAAAPPSYPRWFGLDDPQVKARAAQAPFLLTWVVGVPDLDAAIASCSYDVGKPVAMARGVLRWRIALKDDGALAAGGLAPLLIEWPPGPHPSAQMADLGCALDRLELITAQPADVAAQLASVGADHLAQISAAPPIPAPAARSTSNGTTDVPARLRAHIKTPHGVVTLE